MIEEVICLHKFLGHCKECIIDFNPEHHPNNYDCPRFIKTTIYQFYVVSSKDSRKSLEAENGSLVVKT